MSEEKLPVDERLHMLTQQIVRARIFYDLWWFTYGPDTRDQILDTLNKNPDFSRFNEHSHFVSMIIHCAVVWDKGKRNISLPSIARGILEPARYPEHGILHGRIDIAKTSAEGIMLVRHKAIAHRSAIDDYAKVFEDAGVKPDELKGAIGEWLTLTNELRAIRGLSAEEFRDVPLDHFQAMIHHLGGPDLRPSSYLDGIFES